MQKVCKQCQVHFEVTSEDFVFYDKVSPVFNGKKYPIPCPTHCPDCRQQRRWAFQNQQYLYKRPSSLTGKIIVSAYSGDKPFPVYEKQEWVKIDNTEAGIPFDVHRPFFDQFRELFLKTPKEAVLQTGEMVNSDFTHFVGWLKNCYLVFDAGKCEDCLYSTFLGYNKNCIDVLDMQRNELCYDCVDLTDCYRMFHATFCRNCSFSAFLFDCIGCKSCIACVNLRNKEYCVFNQKVGKEEYERRWKEIFNGSWTEQQDFKEQWRSFALQCPHRAVHNINAPDSTGDYLVNCSNMRDCYKCFECRDMKHCQYLVLQSNDLHDVSAFGENLSFSYELSSSGGLMGRIAESSCCFSAYIFYGGNNVYYSIHCLENCKNVFGCCDLKGKQYCILNKQYTQSEYEQLVPKIIDHMRATSEWGEFFPIELSPFCYNETLAQMYFPLSRNDAIARGYRWKDIDPKEYLPQKTQLFDKVYETGDSITNELLACSICHKNYKIISQELSFYREMGLPIPRLCPDCRSFERTKRRNPQRLWSRTCAKCGKEIQTSYSPERPEIVYCESCYLQSVY